MCDSGIVEEDIEAAKLSADFIDHGSDLPVPLHIGLNRHRLNTRAFDLQRQVEGVRRGVEHRAVQLLLLGDGGRVRRPAAP